MAKNGDTAPTAANGHLPAYVEQGHLSIVFDRETSTVGPSTPSGSDPEGTNSPPDVPETNKMAEPPVATSEEGDGQTAISMTLFHKITTKESTRLQNLMNISKLEGQFDDGYDSDGETGPYCNMEQIEGLYIFDEEDIVQYLNNEEEMEDAKTHDRNSPAV